MSKYRRPTQHGIWYIHSEANPVFNRLLFMSTTKFKFWEETEIEESLLTIISKTNDVNFDWDQEAKDYYEEYEEEFFMEECRLLLPMEYL